MALVVWKNNDNTWSTIVPNEERLDKLTPFHEVADVIMSNVEIESLITELLESYAKNEKAKELNIGNAQKTSYKEKSECLKNVVMHLVKSRLNVYILGFLKDMSSANKLRDMMAHRNTFEYILKDTTYKDIIKSDRNLVYTGLKRDIGLYELDKKADIHQIFMGFDKLIIKHMALISQLQQGLADTVAAASLAEKDDDCLLNIIGLKEEEDD